MPHNKSVQLQQNLNLKLDKYYTKKEIAEQCYLLMADVIEQLNLDNILYIEPSAGAGVFLDVIQGEKLGFDIDPPKNKNQYNIQYNDFIKDNLFDLLSQQEMNKNIVFIGNPPFGQRSKLAIQFINKAFNYSNLVGFIVPIQFRKWSVQSKIDKNAKLILDVKLKEKAFEFMGKDYKVRSCFQIWALNTLQNDFKNLRLTTKPPTKHPDFEMYQYNRTTETLKFFDYDWDFAVYRQGYLDYTFKAYKKEDCNKKQQWIFFKAKDRITLNKLLSLDFEKLSKKNTGIPGFGKADVIQEFLQMFEQKGNSDE